MKKTIILIILIFQIGLIKAQDTIPHILGDCIESGKEVNTTYPDEIFFNYMEDTLFISGRIGANCCGTHLALIEKLNDTIFINTIDTGELCTCTCIFNFEIKIPTSINDTIVVFNNIVYNVKGLIGSVKKINLSEDEIQLLPNPFVTGFRIKADFIDIKTVRISDLSGKVLKKIDNYNSQVISTNDLPKGFFLINITTGENKHFIRKAIKNY